MLIFRFFFQICSNVSRLIIDLGNLKMNSEKNEPDSNYTTAVQSATSLLRQDSQAVCPTYVRQFSGIFTNLCALNVS